MIKLKNYQLNTFSSELMNEREAVIHMNSVT